MGLHEPAKFFRSRPSKLYVRYGEKRNSAAQRLLSVAEVKRTGADWHEAAVGYGDRRWSE